MVRGRRCLLEGPHGGILTLEPPRLATLYGHILPMGALTGAPFGVGARDPREVNSFNRPPPPNGTPTQDEGRGTGVEGRRRRRFGASRLARATLRSRPSVATTRTSHPSWAISPLIPSQPRRGPDGRGQVRGRDPKTHAHRRRR